MNKNSLPNKLFWEEEIYAAGKHLNLYPYDSVVSFVYRFYPKEKVRNEVKILEIGCGAGNNLWFIAREGFRAAGLDISPSAISFAKKRFDNEKLNVDLNIGSFLDLSWGDKTMDMCIDRCSTACVGLSDQLKAIQQVRRVLRPGGYFFFNGYSDEHTSAQHGTKLEDGRITNIKQGTLQGVGGIGFLSETDIQFLFENGWEIKSIEHIMTFDLHNSSNNVHAEWRVISQRL